MKEIDLHIPVGAIFSNDRKYRYALWRVWSQARPILLVIGLNPSDANELRLDPTVTRCVVRADMSGFGGLLMANLYGYVSSVPDVLLGGGDTIGEFTDYYLRQMIQVSGRTLVGWGSFKPVQKRAPIVLEMIKDPYCLGVNADGQPKHPLYLGYNVPMVRYNA